MLTTWSLVRFVHVLSAMTWVGGQLLLSLLLLSGGHGIAVAGGHDWAGRVLAIVTLLGAVGVVLFATMLVPT